MIDTPLILIVDDNLLLQRAAVRVLSQAGYRTCTADDGQSALRLARSDKPDLILLDVELPDISGFEVCRQLKADPALTGCFIVMLSSNRIDSPSQVKGLDGGADGYIARPIPNDELVARVRGLLRIKHAEDRLRASEERLREVLENSLDASYKRNLQTNVYDYLSTVFARLSGYTLDEMKTLPIETVLDLIHPDDRAEVERVVAESRSGAAGTAYQVDYRFRHKAGQYRWLQDRFTVLRDAGGQPLALIGSVSDITDRKQAEEKIREKDIQFRKLSANVSDLIFQFTRRLDGTYHVPIASEGIRNIFGCSPEDVLEDFDPIGRVIFPEDSARVISDIEYSAEHLTFFTCEFRVQIPGKAIQWIYSRSTPEKLADGSITWYGFNANITERKQLEQALIVERDSLEQRVIDRTRELAAANDRLHGLDRLKSKFVSDVSHELRTPLTSLMLYLSLLERGKPEKRAHYLDSSLEQAKRMKQLIEDILDLSRLEREMAAPVLEPIDLNAVLERVVIAQQPHAEAAGLKLTLDAGPGLPLAQGDVNQLLQVFTNLIANAISYTPAGEISITSNAASDQVPPQAGDFVCVEVRDTGLGIDPVDVPHVFERFYRGQRTRDIRGTGLGLAIVKEIVEAHGGRLEVDSRVGAGTTFRVYLPGVG